MARKVTTVIVIIALLFIISYALSKAVNIDIETADKVAIIPIVGAILPTESSSAFYPRGIAASAIIGLIEDATKNSRVKAILLEINSPGGTVVASKEVADAVKRSPKPVVALIKDIGTSGAYWVASAADLIVADPLSITGSIGVTASYLEFSKLFEEYGITYQPLKAGKYKDIGSPFKELTEEERPLLEKKLATIHNHFIREIAKNRNLTASTVQQLATGIYYLGEEAYELGLIDYLGNKELALNLSKELAGITEAETITYKKERSILDVLSSLQASSFYHLGRGLGEAAQPSPSLIPSL